MLSFGFLANNFCNGGENGTIRLYGVLAES
jgi:hypothetical protein